MVLIPVASLPEDFFFSFTVQFHISSIIFLIIQIEGAGQSQDVLNDNWAAGNEKLGQRVWDVVTFLGRKKMQKGSAQVRILTRSAVRFSLSFHSEQSRFNKTWAVCLSDWLWPKALLDMFVKWFLFPLHITANKLIFMWVTLDATLVWHLHMCFCLETFAPRRLTHWLNTRSKDSEQIIDAQLKNTQFSNTETKLFFQSWGNIYAAHVQCNMMSHDLYDLLKILSGSPKS